MFRHLIAVVLMALCPTAGLAQMDGHGRDAWQVTGVAVNDKLNVRTGPGTDYMVIGAVAHDANGLKMITCVPFLTQEHYYALTDRERADLPARWCLMESGDQRTKGWVSVKFLQEDVSSASQEMDPMLSEAIALVREVYERSENASDGSMLGPLHPSVARSYFFSDVVARLAQGGLGADPLYDAQDTQISKLRVFAPAELAIFRGRVTVHVTFENFGRPQKVALHLRVDGSLAEPALRIMQIEHENWVFP